ncbi:predicted protein [Plenodomus lingam JN3]|uniref:Predicted protein n=1 Tax=Leptosphaeria maculans (strain JN3 / isolate v23.1.3 / race Av1-4-5-6-7-8) TaxID=985895 RepID=E4ZMG3_LEPMJ|nr:predicted protein [Plenodomus lingam JN3]CBX92832.1 predicted protein [Plenodomus lingam JN3]
MRTGTAPSSSTPAPVHRNNRSCEEGCRGRPYTGSSLAQHMQPGRTSMQPARLPSHGQPYALFSCFAAAASAPYCRVVVCSRTRLATDIENPTLANKRAEAMQKPCKDLEYIGFETLDPSGENLAAWPPQGIPSRGTSTNRSPGSKLNYEPQATAPYSVKRGEVATDLSETYAHTVANEGLIAHGYAAFEPWESDCARRSHPRCPSPVLLRDWLSSTPTGYDVEIVQFGQHVVLQRLSFLAKRSVKVATQPATKLVVINHVSPGELFRQSKRGNLGSLGYMTICSRCFVNPMPRQQREPIRQTDGLSNAILDSSPGTKQMILRSSSPGPIRKHTESGDSWPVGRWEMVAQALLQACATKLASLHRTAFTQVDYEANSSLSSIRCNQTWSPRSWGNVVQVHKAVTETNAAAVVRRTVHRRATLGLFLVAAASDATAPGDKHLPLHSPTALRLVGVSLGHSHWPVRYKQCANPSSMYSAPPTHRLTGMECAGQDGVVDTASFRRACLYDVRPRKRGLSITTYRNGANDDDDYSRASRLPRCHMFIDVFASTAGKISPVCSTVHPAPTWDGQTSWQSTPRQTFASCRALTVAAASRFNSARNIPSTAGPFSVRRAQVAAQNADHQALDGSTLDSAQR